jgi:hypothetical protein
MIDAEDQTVQKRGAFMETITSAVPTVRVMLSYVMVMHPMGNNSIAVTPAVVKAARTRLPMPIHQLVEKRFCLRTKNAAVCVA